MIEHDEEENSLLDDLIRYADHHKDFNREFIDKIYDFREKNGFITENQLRALKGIRTPKDKDDIY